MSITRSPRLTVCALLAGIAAVIGSPVLETLGIQARVLSAALANSNEALSSTVLFGRNEESADVLLVVVAMLQLVGIVMFEAWALVPPRAARDERD